MFTQLFPLGAILLIIAVGALWARSSNQKRARQQEERRTDEENRARIAKELPVLLQAFPEQYRAAVLYCGAFAANAAVATSIKLAASCFRKARWSATNLRKAEARSNLNVALTFLDDAKRIADELRSNDQANQLLKGE